MKQSSIKKVQFQAFLLFRSMLIDYLIIGQGLAGSILATHLLHAGKSIAVIEQRQFPTASSVAAGLINPFTGPKMVKSWKFDELISFGTEYYRNAEREFECDFFRERKIFRPFQSIEEQNDWYGKSTLPGYAEYIHRICDESDHSAFVNSPVGGLESRAWTLNVPVFLDSAYIYLKNHGIYQEEQFDEDILEIGQYSLRYRDIEAKQIVFCTGYRSVNSRFFNWLPLVPVKGELLDIKMPGGSGFDILKAAKSKPNPPLVIMLTNYATDSYRNRALKDGADYFFDKSTDYEFLLRIINEKIT